MCGESQELSQASSPVGTVERDVGVLETSISCDARQCTRYEKCARAMVSMPVEITQAYAANLMLPSHSHEAAPATATSCAQRVLAGCVLGACELGRHGMIPAYHAPRRSFHPAMPMAEPL
jgi:hypothetical protein